MKRKLLLFIIIMMIISCKNKISYNDSENQSGKFSVQMSLKKPIEDGFVINKVTGKLIGSGFLHDFELNIENDSASSIVENLSPAEYSIFINAYQDTILIATGNSTIFVNPGVVTTAEINMQYTPGALEIIVNWDDPHIIPQKILFIGNSHTYTNDGVDFHLKNLMEESFPNTEFNISRITYGGYTLEDHYHNQNTIDAIQSDSWDYVVLQEQSTRPIYETQLFYDYADSLCDIIYENNSKPVFL